MGLKFSFASNFHCYDSFLSQWPEVDLAFPFVSIFLHRSGPIPALNQFNAIIQLLTKWTIHSLSEIPKDMVQGHSNISHVSLQRICDSCKDVNTGNFG